MKNSKLINNSWVAHGLFISALIGSTLSLPSLALAKAAAYRRQAPPTVTRAATDSALTAIAQKQISEALALVRAGQCDKAAPVLYAMTHRSELAREKYQIKYLLGSCLMEMGLYQVAAFQFVDVIRNGASKYNKQSIEKLITVADNLGDETLLNYATSKVKLNELPPENADMINYRIGEVNLKSGHYPEAERFYEKVGTGSRYFYEARYNRGLAYLEMGKPNDAFQIFQDLVNQRAMAPITDVNKVAAQLALARSLYQAGKWDEAVTAYQDVPRDSVYWHQALFESSWALFRAARFRSVLSRFQSLHSDFYSEFYLPESFLLRATVYLYICKYDEMEKVLQLFEKTYDPMRVNLDSFLKANTDSISYFSEVEKAYEIRRDNRPVAGLRLPYPIDRAVLEQGDVKRSLSYLRKLVLEKEKLERTPSLNKSSFARYGIKILTHRLHNAKITSGENIKLHLISMQQDLNEYFMQSGFIHYEMINGKKESLKKRIAGKNVDARAIDEKIDRDFYVDKGYEYWPFDGEYWLDEIGNYQYLGKQSCE